MGLTVGDRNVRPLTAEDVLRMVETGILSEDEPVELLHGVLTAVSAKAPRHVAVKMRLVRWLMGADPDRYAVRTEDPLAVPDRTSLPEPDIAVVERDDTTIAHPTSALLVIEVAVASLRVDTTVKPALYAAARVPELWVADVVGRQLRVFRDPRGATYAEEHVHAAPTIRPVHVDVGPLDLRALFAGV
jgi:hypothetical protein